MLRDIVVNKAMLFTCVGVFGILFTLNKNEIFCMLFSTLFYFCPIIYIYIYIYWLLNAIVVH